VQFVARVLIFFPDRIEIRGDSRQCPIVLLQVPHQELIALMTGERSSGEVVRATSRMIAWDLGASSPHGEQLPRMLTDVTLRRGNRTLIIDAKYYSQTLQHSQSGKATVHSNHLYKILSYVTNEDRNHDGSVSGLLLYAKTDALAQPSLDVKIQGNRIGAQTLDLGQPWETVAAQLEGICLWIDG
jgi:hypothetical protein